MLANHASTSPSGGTAPASRTAPRKAAGDAAADAELPVAGKAVAARTRMSIPESEACVPSSARATASAQRASAYATRTPAAAELRDVEMLSASSYGPRLYRYINRQNIQMARLHYQSTRGAKRQPDLALLPNKLLEFPFRHTRRSDVAGRR